MKKDIYTSYMELKKKEYDKSVEHVDDEQSNLHRFNTLSLFEIKINLDILNHQFRDLIEILEDIRDK